MEKSHPPHRKNVAAARPPIAVVGCGAWGRNHVRALHQLSALAAVCDANVEIATRLAAEFSVTAIGFRELLEDSGISGVVIAAPAEQHYRLAREVLDAGKHVLVEKPLALSVVEAEGLSALAEAKGLTLMVGHLLQYHPAFLALKELTRKGRLGRLRYLYSTRLNLGRVRREENILWSFAPHDISMILALVGEQPDGVHAVGASYLHKAIADVTTTHLSFPSGVNAHVFVSWLHPFKEQRLVVVGEEGMAVFDDAEPWDRKLVLYPHRIDWIDGAPQPARADAMPVSLTPDEPLRLELEHFIECLVHRTSPRSDGAEGTAVLRVLTEAQQALNRDRGLAPQAFAPGQAVPQREHVHPSAFIDPGVVIGSGTRIWHFSHLLTGVTVGRNCTIGQNVMIGPDVAVGDGCKIQNNVSIYKGVTLEDDVFCGPSCVFTNVDTPRADIDRKTEFLPTLVKRGATIGANATVVCGSTIGEYAFVAAGAVVTHDVSAFALVAGVPARRIGWVGHAGERLDEMLACPRTGRRYRLTDPETLEEIPSPGFRG